MMSDGPHHSGPGFRISDFESNRIIGDKQFKAAQAVMNGATTPVTGTVRSVHVYMNMYGLVWALFARADGL